MYSKTEVVSSVKQWFDCEKGLEAVMTQWSDYDAFTVAEFAKIVYECGQLSGMEIATEHEQKNCKFAHECDNRVIDQLVEEKAGLQKSLTDSQAQAYCLKESLESLLINNKELRAEIKDLKAELESLKGVNKMLRRDKKEMKADLSERAAKEDVAQMTWDFGVLVVNGSRRATIDPFLNARCEVEFYGHVGEEESFAFATAEEAKAWCEKELGLKP